MTRPAFLLIAALALTALTLAGLWAMHATHAAKMRGTAS